MSRTVLHLFGSELEAAAFAEGVAWVNDGALEVIDVRVCDFSEVPPHWVVECHDEDGEADRETYDWCTRSYQWRSGETRSGQDIDTQTEFAWYVAGLRAGGLNDTVCDSLLAFGERLWRRDMGAQDAQSDGGGSQATAAAGGAHGTLPLTADVPHGGGQGAGR